MEMVQFVLEGVTPLLMHSPQGMKRSDQNVGRKEIPTPEDEAEAGAYRLPNGDLGFPATGVRNCILSGAKGLRVGRRALRPLLAGALLPADPMFPFTDAKGTPISDYEVDVQRAVVQRQGIMRARPKISPPWFLACAFRFNEVVTLDHVKAALGEAGSVVGLGDYRIEKNGWYGSFQLQSEIQQTAA